MANCKSAYLKSIKSGIYVNGSRQRIRTFHLSPSLEIGGMPINQVTHTKCIGVYLDKNLIWNKHRLIDYLKRLHLTLEVKTYEIIYLGYDVSVYFQFVNPTTLLLRCLG